MHKLIKYANLKIDKITIGKLIMNYTYNVYNPNPSQRSYRPRVNRDYVPDTGVPPRFQSTRNSSQGPDVNMEGKFRRIESGAHTNLTELYRYTYDYLKNKDDIYLRKLEILTDNLTKGLPNSYTTGIKEYIACFHSKIFIDKDQREIKKFATKLLDARSALEVKSLYIKSKENEPEKSIAQYMKDKTPEEQWHVVTSVLAFFRKNPEEKYQDFCNMTLAPFGYKLVAVANKTTPLIYRQVVRAAFDGYLSIPTPDDNKKGIGYSPQYVQFMQSKKQLSAPAQRFDNQLFSAMEKSKNMSLLIPDIKKAIRAAHLPQLVVDNLSLSDVAHLMYTKRYPHRTPQPEEMIEFIQINPDCQEGVKTQFWKDFATDASKTKSLQKMLVAKGVSQEYISLMMQSIRENGTPNPTITPDQNFKGVIPSISLHHKFYIQDASFLRDNFMQVDSVNNFEIVIDYPNQKTHKELKHGGDCISQDGKLAYRLVYADDGCGRDAFLSTGLETLTTTQDTARITYNQLAQQGERYKS